MFRRIVVVGTLVLAACGMDSNSSAPNQPDQPSFAGAIPAALSTPSGTAKIALYRTTISTVPVVVCDENDFCTQVNCVAGACAAGSTCNVGNNVCYEQVATSSLFHLDKQPVVSGSTTIRVPCDGNKYTVEVYASLAATSSTTFEIAEMRKTNPFTMSSGCAVDYTPAAALWVPAGTPPDPALVVPAIFSGFTDMSYTIGTQNGGYPFGTFSLSVSPAQTAVTGTTTSFYEPSTNAPITFTGTFNLSSALNPGAETWKRTVTSVVTPLGSGTIASP